MCRSTGSLKTWLWRVSGTKPQAGEWPVWLGFPFCNVANEVAIITWYNLMRNSAQDEVMHKGLRKRCLLLSFVRELEQVWWSHASFSFGLHNSFLLTTFFCSFGCCCFSYLWTLTKQQTLRLTQTALKGTIFEIAPIIPNKRQKLTVWASTALLRKGNCNLS